MYSTPRVIPWDVYLYRRLGKDGDVRKWKALDFTPSGWGTSAENSPRQCRRFPKDIPKETYHLAVCSREEEKRLLCLLA